MNILIIEDEKNLAKEIYDFLNEAKHQCFIAHSYKEASKLIDTKSFQIALIDLKLLDGNGIQLIELIKRKKISAGIIVISANDELDMRISALDAGADDYLIKPFHLSELNARIKALARRHHQQGFDVIDYNEIQINVPKLEVTVNDQVLSLTSKEYELLLYFISNVGKVLTKDAISYSIWNSHSDMDVSNDIIYTHIKNLRKKLLAANSRDYIKSVYGIGYKFDQ